MPTIPMEERVAIEDLTYFYALYVDTRQLDLVVELFADDGVFDETRSGLPEVVRGSLELAQYYRESMVPIEGIVHYISNHLISEYSVDQARGTCYVFCEARLKDGSPVRVFGYYDDDYVKIDGKWRFQSRVVVPLLPSEMGNFLEMSPFEAGNQVSK